MSKKYRLITRSDFDGLVCAMLLKELDMIDDIMFVHPKDMQDGKIAVTNRDITTNLPYVPGSYLAFDHHISETLRIGDNPKNHIIDPMAPSAAHVVYNYYGGKKTFPRITDEIITAVDKADSAQFTRKEILNPTKWVLMSFLMDARTGLGRFRDFRISNYQLMLHLIDYCRDHTIGQIIELPDVKERIMLYRENEIRARNQILRCGQVHHNLLVLDLRQEDPIWTANRFLVYALFPQINISMHVMWGFKRQNTVFAVGKSILNRTSDVNIGALMLEFGGGGHLNAGTCQVDNNRAAPTMRELIQRITGNG